MAKARADTTVPGGRYIIDAEQREDDETGEVKHFGGRVVNAEGETLHEFGPDEENTGKVPEKAKPEPPASKTPPKP